MNRVSSILRRAALALVSAGVAGSMAALGAEPKVPKPEEGKVDGSGKFTPAFIEPNLRDTPPVPPDIRAFAMSLVREREDGVLSIGKVTADPETKEITLPAQVNAVEGTVEYALVTRGGKVHESLLATDASPVHLHLAVLLLGLAPTNANAPLPQFAMEVEWRGNGSARRAALEDLIVRAKESPEGPAKGTLRCPAWEYGGSRVVEGRLMAAVEGSVISLISDPMALVNVPRLGPVDDRLYVPNKGRLPALGMPVTLRLKPVPAKSPASSSPAPTPATP